MARVALPIEDYGLIGDTQTAALVGRDGSIDWLCMPRFDSGAFFAALLGTPKHGRWLVAPKGEARPAGRRYRDNTLILETDFETDEGSVRVIDFMPPRGRDPDVVRIVEGLNGRVEMRMELIVRFDYGAIVPWVRRIDDVDVVHRRARRPLPADPCRDAGRRPLDRFRLRRVGGGAGAFRPDLVPVERAAAPRNRAGSSPRSRRRPGGGNGATGVVTKAPGATRFSAL